MLKNCRQRLFVWNRTLLLILGLILIAVSSATKPVNSQDFKPSQQDESVSSGDLKPLLENAVQEYSQRIGKPVTPHSPEYKVFMRDILLGEYPELMEEAGYEKLTAYALKKLRIEPDQDSPELMEEPTGEDIPTEKVGFPENLSQAEITTQATTYNRQAVAQYALDWSVDGGVKRNSNYPNFTNDCTNFVSQAVKTGGIPQQGSGSCKDEYNSSEWYVQRSAWWCLNSWAWSHSWSVVYPFREYMTNANRTTARLYVTAPGTANSINQLCYDALKGDVIQLRANGSSYHTMIVTSWYYSSWSSSDLYMTYHSGPNNKDVRGKSIRDIIRGLEAGREVVLMSMR